MLSESQIQKEQLVTVDPEAALHALAREIAGSLGDGWSYKCPTMQDGDRLPRWAILVHAEGYALHVTSSEYRNPGRVSVCGSWPRYANGQVHRPHVPYGESEPVNDITVARARGADTIAKEIARRLLPIYVPRWQKAIEAVKQSDESERRRVETLHRFAKLTGTAVDSQRGDHKLFPYIAGQRFEIEVSYDNAVRLEFTLPAEGAARVLAVAIEEAKKSEGAE